jgi:hypothetical protein
MTLANRLREIFPIIPTGPETTLQRELIHRAADRIQHLEKMLRRVRNEREVYADMRDDIDALLAPQSDAAVKP